MKIEKMLTLLGLLFALTMGCGQSDVIFPGEDDDDNGDDDDSTGDDDDDSSDYPSGPYGLEKGKTFPEMKLDTIIDEDKGSYTSKDAYESRSEKTALVIATSAVNCTACPVLLTELTNNKDELDKVATMVAWIRHDVVGTTTLDIDQAANLAYEHDGWSREWMVSNDDELEDLHGGAYPSITVVRLEDMKVVIYNNTTTYTTPPDKGVEKLLEAIDKIDELE